MLSECPLLAEILSRRGAKMTTDAGATNLNNSNGSFSVDARSGIEGGIGGGGGGGGSNKLNGGGGKASVGGSSHATPVSSSNGLGSSSVLHQVSPEGVAATTTSSHSDVTPKQAGTCSAGVSDNHQRNPSTSAKTAALASDPPMITLLHLPEPSDIDERRGRDNNDSYQNISEDFVPYDDITEASWEFTIASSQQQSLTHSGQPRSWGCQPLAHHPHNAPHPHHQPQHHYRHSVNATKILHLQPSQGNGGGGSFHHHHHMYHHSSTPSDATGGGNNNHDSSVHKLEFVKLGRLYGRELERQQLASAWEDIRLAWAHANNNNNNNNNNNVGPTHHNMSTPEPNTATKTSSTSTLLAAKPAEGTRRFVSIAGAAGTGKSSLAETLKASVASKGGFFLMGKFPQQHRLSRQTVEPYAAFEAACNELCELVVSMHTPSISDDNAETSPQSIPSSHDDDPSKAQFRFSLPQFRERLDQEIGADASILTRVIPGLLQLLQADRRDAEESIGYLEAHHQFKYAFRRFIRAVTSFGPMVLVLDDVQWADMASMELLEALISDRESTALLIVGCYRDDEEYAAMPHIQTLLNIRQMESAAATTTTVVPEAANSNNNNTNNSSSNSSLQVQSIAIGNLDVEQVQNLLGDLLALSQSKTAGLAECVHKKTLGNVFFVIQFVTLLQDSGLLVWDGVLRQWTFDVHAVQASTAATENVVSLMTNRMKRLPASIGRVLPIMACLGSTFSVPLLELAVVHLTPSWKGQGGGGTGEDTASNDPEKSTTSTTATSGAATDESLSALQCLSHCESQGLIESSSADVKSYQWVHDKIQEAAFALISELELVKLKLEIGQIFYEQFDAKDLEQNLFILVNLLTTETTDESAWPRHHPIEACKLCLRAGVKTIENSAFEQAAGYLATGIALLPSDCWDTQYELSLELYSTAAEAEYCVGNFERARALSNVVIGLENRPLLDKRRVYNVIIDAIAGEQSAAAAFTFCRTILAKLGCRFPRRGIRAHVLAGMLRVKATLSKYTNSETILQLPLLKDEKNQWIMALLDRFSTYAYLCHPDMLPLVILKGLRLTLSNGVSDYSPPMFAFIGMLLAAYSRDYKGGQAFVNQSLELLKVIRNSRKVESRVLFLAHALVLHWTRPISLSVKPLLASYEVGMNMGDIESACWSIYFYLEYIFRTGTPLKVLLEDVNFYAEVFREVKQKTTIWHVLTNMWQVVLQLTGEDQFDGTLTGSIVNQEQALAEVSADDYVCRHVAIKRMLMYIAFVLGRHDVVYQSIRDTAMDKASYGKCQPQANRAHERSSESRRWCTVAMLFASSHVLLLNDFVP